MSIINFTLYEANKLIPWLNQVFDSIEPLLLKMENLSTEILTLKQTVYSNGGSNKENKISKLQSVLEAATKTIEARIREVQERGIIVRSIPQGLVDFPHILEEREVYLCWIREETTIGFFHETNTGYADRQPL